TPGFIDLHTHSDLQILANPRHEPKLMQGVTTDVIGQDGLSYAPCNEEALEFFLEMNKSINGRPDLDYDWRTVREFLARFDRRVACNVAYLLPHGPIRIMAMGTGARTATASELADMCELVAEGMRDGCIGFSTGLTYAPMMHADTHELTELCRASARWDSVFMPHLRSYGRDVVEATEEAVGIARASGIPLHLTHHQCVFPINRDKYEYYLEVIDRERAAGYDVTCDSYPYVAGSTYLVGMFPGWAQSQGRAAVVRLLQDPDANERLRVEVEETGCDGTHGVAVDWSRVQFSSVARPEWTSACGQRLDALAAARGMRPWELVTRALIDNDGEVNIVAFIGHEHAVQYIMGHPTHMVGSDGILTGLNPHPRVYGTFARYLARYVRELGVLTWEQCIRKMTGASAQRIGLVDRGLVKVGLCADLVIFDPETVQDTATFESPRQYPEGIPYVVVNGQVVKDGGEHTGVLAGRALRRGQPTPA
ncbi:MAG: D-aminoacylase, partial [Armatimonadetes bacterium]|nr:D-aminoacylase [Armatimonadota bacterium]